MVKSKKQLVTIVLFLAISSSVTSELDSSNIDLGVLAELEPASDDQQPLHSGEPKKIDELPDPDQAQDPIQLNFDQIFGYEEDDDSDWYYDPEDTPAGPLLTTSTTTAGPGLALAANDSPPETKTETGPELVKEGTIVKELPARKPLPGPKGTIILYTALVVVLIAGIVLFSIWKNPFENGRPVHQPTLVRNGEEGKRLIDHPFV